jgi:ABC-2 type transport system permease protein
MIGASLYIMACSARNRIRVRLLRLREPRYLVGAIVGAAYFYFTILARSGAFAGQTSRAGRPSSPAVEALGAVAAPIVGLVLLALAGLAWVYPGQSGLLDFTEAEVQFLFPAPLSRRQLLLHRVLRSQLALLFTAVISSLVFSSGGFEGRLRFVTGMWIMLVTARVYFTGVTLSRSRVTTAATVAGRALLAAMVVAGVIVATAIGQALVGHPVARVEDVAHVAQAALTTGLARIALWPFVALAQPLFAPSFGRFLLALMGTAVILALVMVWVIRSDEGLQDAAFVAGERRKAAARTGVVSGVRRARWAGWSLAASGPVEAVFFWKNGMHALRSTGGLMLMRFVALMAVLVGSAITLASAYTQGPAAGFCLLALGLSAFVLILGPQVVRTDLRADLRHLELLRTWPVRPAALIRGEMLWPVFQVTIVEWIALVMTSLLSPAAFPDVPALLRLSITVAAVVLAPALILAQFTIHNAAAVLFPAWVPLDDERPRGLDAMGQRLIMFTAVMLSLALIVAPGAIVGAIAGFVLFRVVGTVALIPAALICALAVAIEVVLATEALGPIYERVDLTAIERGE